MKEIIKNDNNFVWDDALPKSQMIETHKLYCKNSQAYRALLLGAPLRKKAGQENTYICPMIHEMQNWILEQNPRLTTFVSYVTDIDGRHLYLAHCGSVHTNFPQDYEDALLRSIDLALDMLEADKKTKSQENEKD